MPWSYSMKLTHFCLDWHPMFVPFSFWGEGVLQFLVFCISAGHFLYVC
uniref:Uncharacterized protein n=1 Tax=Rhizophora mucronata TaxID=61149 RepID=A0A2P2NJ74_RHIMU